jgi:uncharacterized protein YndB with AHSA1/START domain
LPRYAADRVLLAPLDDVWAFLAEPYNLADWWPGISGVEPDRRGLAPGARWKVIGPVQPTYFRRPQATGTLLVLDVQPRERLAFQLAGDHIDAELTLRAADEARTEVSLVIEGPWLIGLRRAFPRQALARLHSLLRTGEEPF